MVRFKNNLGPFIKWAGGKQSIADQLLPCFPAGFTGFYEPFVGGGSVFMAADWDHAVISDVNSWLVDTYKAIRDDWMRVAKLLDRMPNEKEFFLKLRSRHSSEYADQFERAAAFIYLNKTCFRGLFRVNRMGFLMFPTVSMTAATMIRRILLKYLLFWPMFKSSRVTSSSALPPQLRPTLSTLTHRITNLAASQTLIDILQGNSKRVITFALQHCAGSLISAKFGGRFQIVTHRLLANSSKDFKLP